MKKEKKMTKREERDYWDNLDYEIHQVNKLWDNQFRNYRGKKSNVAILADYIKSLRTGTRFNNKTIMRDTGLTATQLKCAKRNKYIKAALKIMRRFPEDSRSPWEKY
ncbi:MAG: hypothetical protein LUE21_08000 [Oscillospiraceae bacterium]|nr:hypothetical protein [Oscillospiraceae bacterium]